MTTAAATIGSLKLNIRANSGAFSKDIDKINSALDTLDKGAATTEAEIKSLAKATDLLKAEGIKIKEINLTPLEKYEKELLKLKRLLKAGAIDQETFGRASGKLASNVPEFQAGKSLAAEREKQQKAMDDARAKDHQSTMAKGIAVKDLNLKPIEKYKKEIAELRTLLKKGAIDQETFNRAAKKLDSDLGTSGWKGWTASIVSAGAALGALGIAAAGAAIAKLAADGMQSITVTTRLADRLGVTTEALVGLQHAAAQSLGKDQVEAFGDALSDMQEKIGDITLEGGGAKDIVKILGLDAAKLASQDAVTNFKQIADAISKVKSKAEKLHIADTLFGGQGQALLPLLEQGSAGIEQFAAEADKLGISFSRVDAAKVEMANAALGRVSAVIQGIGQDIAISLAPFIESAANAFTNLGIQGSDVAGYIVSGMELIGQGVGIVLDVVHTLSLGWDAMGAAASSVVAGVLTVIADMADALEDFLNMIPGVEVEFGDMLRDMADDASTFADKDWEEFNKKLAAPPPSEGIKQFFDDVKTNADTVAKSIAEAKKPIEDMGKSMLGVGLKVKELEDKLKEQLATFGKDGNEVEIFKLKDLGAAEEDLQRLTKMANDLKGKQLFESNMTPLEKYKKELKELEDLLASGSIDQPTFNRAKGKAAKDSGLNELKFSGAIELGSNEARQSILRHQGIGNKDPNLGIEKNTATMVTQNGKISGYLQKIAKSVGTDETFSFN